MQTLHLRRIVTSRFGVCLGSAPNIARSRQQHARTPLRWISSPSSPSSSSSSSTTTATTQRSTTLAPRPLIALGIETSCDDTCAAIVTSDRQILSEVLRTQHHLHEPMGGIVPKLAHHAHMRHLPEVVKEAIQKAGLGVQEIDIVAVTRGPGLAHCLGVGLNAAKTLAAALNKPLIGVHHMEAHALTARLTTRDPEEKGADEHNRLSDPSRLGSKPYPSFPFLTLLVSGGHTLLLVAHSVNRYTTLASTVDDSIGEAFDKTARELNIQWLPGRAGGPGASLEEFAKGSQNPARYLHQLPIPMSLRTNKREMKFSFAGLKSAVTRIVKQEKAASPSGVMDVGNKQDLAAGFQHCAVTHLCQKVEQGLLDCRRQGIHITSLVISGGVGRNATLRVKMDEVCQRFEHDMSRIPRPVAGVNSTAGSGLGLQAGSGPKAEAVLPSSGLPSGEATVARQPVQVICPPPSLCTDNAVMIAWAGLERYQQGLVDSYDIDIVPKWPLDMLGTGIVPE